MLIIKSTLLIALAIIAVPGLTLCQTVGSQTSPQEAAAQEVLKAEREQREAYLQRDIAKTERLVADEFILTNGRDIGNKKTLIGFMRSSELDPTLTLTAEDTRVTINGDTAIVIGPKDDLPNVIVPIFGNDATELWKFSQTVRLGNQLVSEGHCTVGIVVRDEDDYVVKVVSCSRRPNQFVSHEASCFLISS